MKTRLSVPLWISLAALAILAACGSGAQPKAQRAQKSIDPNLVGPFSSTGRTLALDGNSHLRMSWPGVSLGTHFEGTGVQVTLRDMNNIYNGQVEDSYWDVSVDGNTTAAALHLTTDSNTYTLAHDLADGEHTVWITKRTEGMLGSSEFWGFSLDGDGQFLEAPAKRARHIEVLGSSVEAGYGVGNVNCHGYQDINQDQAKAWPQLLANQVDAELMNTAYSGKGLINNLDIKDDPVNTLPVLSDLADGRDFKANWDFTSWKADVVLVDLGGNDWNGLSASPDATAFTDAYVQLIEKIKTNYPGVKVYLVLNDITHDPARSDLRKLFQGVVTKMADASVKLIETIEYQGSVYACDGHPTADLHQAMAQQIATQVQADTGW